MSLRSLEPAMKQRSCQGWRHMQLNLRGRRPPTPPRLEAHHNACWSRLGKRVASHTSLRPCSLWRPPWVNLCINCELYLSHKIVFMQKTTISTEKKKMVATAVKAIFAFAVRMRCVVLCPGRQLKGASTREDVVLFKLQSGTSWNTCIQGCGSACTKEDQIAGRGKNTALYCI